MLGFPSFKVLSGKIIFKGEDITNLPTDERARRGIGVAFQNPPSIRGVKLGEILSRIAEKEAKESLEALLKELIFPQEFLGRDVNLGFSGGEVKKSEILQVLAQKADFLLLDEPDSGVDIENLQVIGNVLKKVLKGKSALIVTHLGHILHYINAETAHVMIDGTIVCSGSALRILGQILKEGYGWCRKCLKVKSLRCEVPS